MLKVESSKQWINKLSQVNDWVLLGLWMVIGGVLRFTNLDAKPPWTDEFATMVFSLGNDFRSVPLNQVISLDTLLQPLRVSGDVGIGNVVSLLLQEDNPPPLGFWTITTRTNRMQTKIISDTSIQKVPIINL